MTNGVFHDIENGLPLWNGQIYDNSFTNGIRTRGDGEECGVTEYIIYHAMGIVSRLNGEPLFETQPEADTLLLSLRLKDDITFEEMVRAAVRLYDSSESAGTEEFKKAYAKEEAMVKYGADSQSARSFPYPTDEYERAVWYGFIDEGVSEGMASQLTVNWDEYISMLDRMIEKFNPNALFTWKTLAVNPPKEQIGYDGASIALLYAAETLDINVANTTSFAGHWVSAESCRGKEYPVFDYKASVDYSLGYFLNVQADKDINRLLVSFLYSMARISCITHEPLFDWGWQPDDFLSYREAAVSVVRLYESTDRTAYETSEKILEEVLKTDAAKEIVKKADERRKFIRSTPTEIVHSDTFIQGETYTGKAYYVSNNGSDSNDGLSEKTPFATLKRLERVKLKFGDAIFFERGGIWYNQNLSRVLVEGITVSAYGSGDKPKFYSSYENSSGKEKWELYAETEDGGKIWKYYRIMPDVAVIVMNDGETYAQRANPFWNGKDYYPLSQKGLGKEPYDMQRDLKDMEFFPYLKFNKVNNGRGETALDTDRVFLAGYDSEGREKYVEGELFLRCDAGNPGEIFKEIQMSTPSAFVDG
ncbi:MAG: hypothetical protein IKZ39_07840, partial [Lachnospiraceae bacterium]|nr:hypothetical protein [Lachnospiraceae bacterium]